MKSLTAILCLCAWSVFADQVYVPPASGGAGGTPTSITDGVATVTTSGGAITLVTGTTGSIGTYGGQLQANDKAIAVVATGTAALLSGSSTMTIGWDGTRPKLSWQGSTPVNITVPADLTGYAHNPATAELDIGDFTILGTNVSINGANGNVSAAGGDILLNADGTVYAHGGFSSANNNFSVDGDGNVASPTITSLTSSIAGKLAITGTAVALSGTISESQVTGLTTDLSARPTSGSIVMPNVFFQTPIALSNVAGVLTGTAQLKTTFTVNTIPYASATNAIAFAPIASPLSISTGTLTYSGVSSIVPGTSITTSTSGNAVTVNATADSHNLLSATHTDTVAASPVRGDMIVGNSTPKWDKVPVPSSAGSRWMFNGSDPYWAGPFSFYFSDTFIRANVGEWTSSPSGLGSSSGSATGDSTHPGVWTLTTGTTTTGRSAMTLPTGGVLFGGLTWELFARVKIATLSDGTETFAAYAGFVDSSSAEATDGAYFSHDNSTGNWIAKTSNNSSRTTASGGSNVAVNAGGYDDLRIVVNSAGTLATFYVWSSGAWVSIGSSSSNIPTAAGRETGIGFAILKSAGTTSRSLSIDQLTIIAY